MKSLLIALIVAAPAAIPAAASPQAEVAAALDKLMVSVNTGDANAFSAIVEPRAMIQVQQFKPDGSSELRVLPTSDFAARMRDRVAKKIAVDEQLIDPQILISRDFAHVWAPYSVDVGGKRSHCGVNSFAFVKTAGQWRVTNMTWTADPQGCPK
jgi:hypothetical protein